MSNELATVGTVGYGIEGLETMGAQDVILPRYSIVQAMSRGVGEIEPGWFYNNIAQTGAHTVVAVILRVNHTRTMWSGDLSDKSPECSSYDGITGRTYGNCKACEYNKWAEKGEKSCRAGYMFLCVDPDSDEMFMLPAMGSSVRPAKVLISQFVSKRKPPFSAQVKFGTQKVEDDKGKYWVLAPMVYKWLEAAEVEKYRAMYQGMVGVSVRDAEPEESTTTPLDEEDF